MRFDLEQFLALTMALGTAGAVGAAVYTNHASRAEAAPLVEETAPEENEPTPEIVTKDEPAATPAPDAPAPAAPAPAPPTAAPAPLPAFDGEPEDLEAAPGPTVEGMTW